MEPTPSLKREAAEVEVLPRFVELDVVVVVVVVAEEEIARFRFRCGRAACRRPSCLSSRPEKRG
jgi:hypothetical protein